MDKQKLSLWVEDYLNCNSALELDFESGADAYERFLLHTIKRLCRAYELLILETKGKGDFLLALRDYLLTFQTKLSLPTAISIANDNEYGVAQDPVDGKYFASYQFPDYVNHNFCESVFLTEKPAYKTKNLGYDLHTDALIQKITGFKFFKSTAQKLAVYGAINTPDGYTTLVSLPTGGGKSLITQTLAYQKPGLTVVIVPTVSLAIDQVRVAKTIIQSSTIEDEIFAYSSGVDASPILKAIKNKLARLLFISPEALINNSGFSDVIKEANATRYLKNIIIDEAHIVVDWGASFRIDYQCLESWRNKLLLSNPSIRTVLLSATFEQHCISILKDFFSKNGENWIEIRCDSLRHEPRFIFAKAASYSDKNRKLIELVRKMPHPMIIYVARPDDASEIVSFLSENGIENVKSFTGLTTGARRKELIDAWVDDQFEIMVATSAFGVGVDKSDVRTVIHMYIPQNANAYYQELGRGGRDRLPCLSIMCTYPDDVNISFGRVSKKVMTTEKIVGRWNSMYSNRQSHRIGNLNYIDTSIKPNYAATDVVDDSPTSDADMNWNIYVLLFLRRYGLIKICEVLPQNGKYVFVIEILKDILRINDVAQINLIDKYRTEEWKYYLDSFGIMKSAIKYSSHKCWSEMFFETYDKVSEYCAGCNAHSDANESDFLDYPLKSTVERPVKELAQDQIALFAGTKNIITIPAPDEIPNLVKALEQYRLSVFVTGSSGSAIIDSINIQKNVMILNPKDLRELIKKRAFYYVSGIVAIQYDGTPREVFDLMKYVLSNLEKHPQIRTVHILKENFYFDWINKTFTDLVDGLVLPVRAFIP